MNEAPRIRPERNVELGASAEPFQNLHEFIRKARANLNQNAWDYIVGAAETETTMRRNRMALDEIAFRPRVLRDVREVDGSVELFGRRMRLPVVLAGGLGGTLQTGRSLDYLSAGDENRKMCSLYLGIMDRMGITLDRFGDADTRLANF